MARSLAPLVACGLALAACGRADEDLRLVGTVERTLIEAVAPASEVITEIPVERGERVEAGRLLVRLDATLADAEVARAEAALSGARTGAAVASLDLGRASKLRRDRVASEQELDRAHLVHDEAEAKRLEAEAALAIARKRRADLELRAPAAGVVDQLPFDVGERVAAGAVLAVLLDAGDPWVRVWIPEPRYAEVVPGTRATVHVDGVAGTLAGRVLEVAREPEFTPHYALTERDRVPLTGPDASLRRGPLSDLASFPRGD